MNIQELKLKSSEQIITQAEELGIENASTLRKQEILFAILKKVAEKEEITGAGVLQLLQDGFGFLRAMESNYLQDRMISMLVQVKLENLVLELEIQLRDQLELQKKVKDILLYFKSVKLILKNRKKQDTKLHLTT